MRLFGQEAREYRKQKRKARRAFYSYAKNGWECPWIRKNSLWQAIRK